MSSALQRILSSNIFIRALSRKSNWFSLVYITSRKYCDEKTIYQREEEGKKARTVFGQNYPEWRKPWVERDGEWKTKLGLFNEKNPSPEILNAMQKLPYLNFEQIKEWWLSMKVTQEIQNQKYLPERVATLGANLSAVHFFIYRHAAIRLKDSKEWLVGIMTNLNLPKSFEEGYYVEAIDCTNFHHNGIRYEGLQILSGLNFLKWLSLKNQKHIDAWCLDRLAGQNGKTLEYLDISGCNLDVGCIFALARMPVLKMVVLTDPGDNIPVQAALSFLEQERPELLVKTVEQHSITTEKPSISN